jgi:hypothetical protein
VQPAQFEAPGVTVSGTIVANNTTLADCNGDVTDGGYNLDSDGSCSWSATSSVTKADPKLGGLADNGGPTLTEVPAKGPAVDVIPSGSVGCVAGATDQRGVSRPQGSTCDIGAVEVEQTPIVIGPDALPDGTVGQAYGVTLSATGGLGAPYVWSLASGSSLPDGLALSADGKIAGTPTKAGSYSVTVSVDDPVTKTYTLVIAAAVAPSSPAAPAGGAAAPIANTGADVLPLAGVGGGAVLAGLLLRLAAGLIIRRPGRHRSS